jgi:hypothetical protein
VSVPWLVAHKADRRACALADRHYSRRKIGAPQMMPPGQTLVLVSETDDAVFGWWRPHPDAGIVAMNGLDGWTCTIFRNEGKWLSSCLIVEAERELLATGHNIGPDGLLTYVFGKKVRSTNPGFCFAMAGWKKRGLSADRRKVLWSKPRELAGVAPWDQLREAA